MASRRSLTPEKTADRAIKRRPLFSASRRASVVLPVPGAPHRISEGRPAPRSTSLRRMRPSPTRCSCPTNSANERGRIRSASGAPSSGTTSGASSPNRLLVEFQRSMASKRRYNYRRNELKTRPAGNTDFMGEICRIFKRTHLAECAYTLRASEPCKRDWRVDDERRKRRYEDCGNDPPGSVRFRSGHADSSDRGGDSHRHHFISDWTSGAVDQGGGCSGNWLFDPRRYSRLAALGFAATLGVSTNGQSGVHAPSSDCPFSHPATSQLLIFRVDPQRSPVRLSPRFHLTWKEEVK